MGISILNIPTWIEENKKDFMPPVCNKMMFGDGQLKVFYVGGPNIREDFHMNEGEELFYQVKGEMNVVTLEHNKFKDVIIKEGEIFLLPGRIPHSPRRLANTVGLVIERERLKEENDCLRWFVDGSTETLYEKWMFCEDLGTQLVPIIKEYFASEQYKTGKPIPEELNCNPPWIPDSNVSLEKPFPLKEWIKSNRKQIDAEGSKRLFGSACQSDIVIVGPSSTADMEKADNIEVWIWQIEGESEIKIRGKNIKLKTEDSYLIEKNTSYKHFRPIGCIAMTVKMDPKRNSKLGKKF